MISGKWSNFRQSWTTDQCGLNIGKMNLDKVKATLPVGKWNAQWMQNPTSEEGALIKREWWRLWEEDQPPPCIMSYNLTIQRFMKKETADFSAITTWGVFYPEEGKPKLNLARLCKRAL